MPIKIEWRREPNPQHTGSAELNGLQNKPFLYVHPEDQAQQPRRSPCASWTYNQNDMANNNIVAWQLFLNLQGRVSFADYLLHRRHYQGMAAADRFEGWAGQDGTDEVYGSPLASGIQPSGFGSYSAYISQAPHKETATTVTVTATLTSFGVLLKSIRAVIGMARSVTANVYVYNEQGEVDRVRNNIRLSRFLPFRLRSRRKQASFNVVIPAGGEVMIGKVECGLGYELRSLNSNFYCSTRLDFQVT